MRALICLLLLLGGSFSALARDSVQVPLGDSASFGPADAKVVIVEFIDFQ